MDSKIDLELPATVSAMRQDLRHSQRSVFRRVIALWPFLFIAISVTGLAYLALTAAR
jgi:hypothetical protein